MGFPGRPPEQCALAFVPLFSFYSGYGKKGIGCPSSTADSQQHPTAALRSVRLFSSVTLLKLALTTSRGTLTTTRGEYSAGWLSV